MYIRCGGYNGLVMKFGWRKKYAHEFGRETCWGVGRYMENKTFVHNGGRES